MPGPEPVPAPALVGSVPASLDSAASPSGSPETKLDNGAAKDVSAASFGHGLLKGFLLSKGPAKPKPKMVKPARTQSPGRSSAGPDGKESGSNDSDNGDILIVGYDAPVNLYIKDGIVTSSPCRAD